ncbi:MAG: carboxyl transferase domain-containing protein [Pseudomonadota bacterium]
MSHDESPLDRLTQRLAQTLDAQRPDALARRRAKGYRSARENLEDLIDADTFTEYGQLAIAAQRSRRDETELYSATAADGVITGTACINRELVGIARARAAVAINDYSVLAGTQGFFHHKKLDRLLDIAAREELPVVMYTEGGGGRPGDTDVTVQMAGLDTTVFVEWARLAGKVPRIAVNNGYCFAGNAALFGAADITIATRTSWIGMAGPAMIEGGGLGQHAPTDIGPTEVQAANGVIDIIAEDEADATRLAQKALSYFQGPLSRWSSADQLSLRESVPTDRRWGYKIRPIIDTLVDTDSFLALREHFGRGLITGLARFEGKPVGVIANSAMPLGGAVDAESADKAARFLSLCDAFALPILALIDTPGFMVGPGSEQQGAVRRMAGLFTAGANLSVPIITVVLRKGYGLGAMAMAGGSFKESIVTVAWPGAEFGGMGLEGAVRLGYKKELDAVPEGDERDALFEQLVRALYERGKATEAAAFLEIDAVIDPAETRRVVLRALRQSSRG